MAHDLILDGALVAVARLVADVAVDQRVLGEHFAHQELLGKGERLNLDLGNVHELGLGVVAQVVVAKEGVAADLMRDLEWHLVPGTGGGEIHCRPSPTGCPPGLS